MEDRLPSFFCVLGRCGDSLFGDDSADHFDVRCPADAFEDADGDPVHIELIPGEPVACRGWEGVVIVVPAFTKGQYRDEPIICREIACRVGTPAVKMRERIDEPRRVPTQHHTGGTPQTTIDQPPIKNRMTAEAAIGSR